MPGRSFPCIYDCCIDHASHAEFLFPRFVKKQSTQTGELQQRRQKQRPRVLVCPLPTELLAKRQPDPCERIWQRRPALPSSGLPGRAPHGLAWPCSVDAAVLPRRHRPWPPDLRALPLPEWGWEKKKEREENPTPEICVVHRGDAYLPSAWPRM
jgi:hypothetical protein